MVASYIFPHDATSPSTEATLILSSSPSSVAAAEKAKQRQQAAMLDAWLALHGDNLYPCREEKERLAKDMSMTYIQVNRWFANRRRKQTKRRKTETESPRSLAPLSSSSSSVPASNGNVIGIGSSEQEQRNLNWPTKSPSEDFIQSEQKKDTRMVVHTVHSDLHKADIEALKGELRRDTPSAHLSTTNFQQVPDVNRSLASPSSTPDQQRIPQSTLDNKLLPTPPAYAPSPLNAAAAAAAAAAAGNFPAAIAAAAAAQTANPFLLAAALGLQQQQQQNASATLPWISNAQQSFTAMLPYLQQLQAQAQQQAQAQVALAQHIAAQQAANLHQQLKTAAAAAAAARTSLTSKQPQQQQQLQPQWLSPPPSVPPQVSAVRQTTACSSPMFSTGAESTSSLSELLELSPRPQPTEPQQPPSPPASSSSSLYNDEKIQQQFLFDEDLMIDSLMEERKDLSEKESIAVAVLAGMAACQR